MPIVTTSTIAHKLVKVSVDMDLMQTLCYFSRTLNGVADGGVEMLIEGADMGALLSTQATAGQALGNEITDAIYAVALARGVIEGTMQ